MLPFFNGGAEMIKNLADFTEEERQKAMERYYILEPYFKKLKSVRAVSESAKVPNRTLYNWISRYKNDGLAGLIDKTRKDRNRIKIDESTIKFVHNEYFSNRGISIASIHRKTKQWCNNNTLSKPSYYQIYNIIKRIPENLKAYSNMNSKKYAEKYDGIYTRECERPNEIWQADHTLLDIEVLNEKNEIERPWLTIVLDDYSRAIAGFRIAFGTPDTERTALVLRQAIWKKGNSNWPICGIPEKFYTDHGKDYTSEHMRQVSANLKIELIYSKIGIPKGRGKIERFFQTVNLMFLELLPGYTKNKKSRKHLTLEDLNNKFEHFILNEYHYRQHGTTKEKPIQKWNQPDFLPQLPESRELLDLLLLTTTKPRKIHKDGIYFKGLRYFSTNLIAYITEEVFIRYDPQDISEIRVYLNNQFLSIAYCSDLENQSISIKEIERLRANKKRELGKSITRTRHLVQNLNRTKPSNEELSNNAKQVKKSKLKRYKND